jgi:two-component system response regulator CpxR
MEHVLIIDDDVALCDLLREYLSPEGFKVEVAHDGPSGIEHARSKSYDLIVLDVMLPGCSGFEALREIRRAAATPVIMLTARGGEVDRIVGLEMGADDYLAKPFNPRELIARARAILRRTKGEQRSEPSAALARKLTVGDVDMDLLSRRVNCAGEEVELTAVEFDLLKLLLEQAGHIVSREHLIKEVLGRSLSPYDRSIDVHVSKLRKKLGHRVAGTERIKTIRSIGYLYALTTHLDPHNS